MRADGLVMQPTHPDAENLMRRLAQLLRPGAGLRREIDMGVIALDFGGSGHGASPPLVTAPV